jgi:hypothetical protein
LINKIKDLNPYLLAERRSKQEPLRNRCSDDKLLDQRHDHVNTFISLF